MRFDPINLYDFEARAKHALPPHIWDFIEAGAHDELTTKRNRAALDAISLRPRFLIDIHQRDTSTSVLGQTISFPVMIAPAGHQGIAHPQGELATARGAHAAGTMMVVGNDSNHSLEDVAEVSQGPLWFQLYHRDFDLSQMLLRRAEEAGYLAICVTVDNPVPGTKERDIRNRYVRPWGLELANFVGEQAGLGLVTGTEQAYRWDRLREPLSWPSIQRLRSITSLPLVVKGIRTAEDARLCVENGVDGILVSNHGGRQMDGTLSSIETLPRIVEAVNGRAEIYLDSGIRRGIDVIRALALGARAVLIGRPLFWGLAVDGEAGVRKVLELLRNEFDRGMAYCGATSVPGINRQMVALPGEAGWVSV